MSLEVAGWVAFGVLGWLGLAILVGVSLGQKLRDRDAPSVDEQADEVRRILDWDEP